MWLPVRDFDCGTCGDWRCNGRNEINKRQNGIRLAIKVGFNCKLNSWSFRYSRLQMFFKIPVLKIFFKFYRKTTVLETLLDKVPFLKALLKRDSTQVFSYEIYKALRTPFFTEQLQWLLLTFNSYFQRSPERKPVRLSAINTRFSWKKHFRSRKSVVPHWGR